MLDSSVNPEYFDFSQADRIILSFGDAGLPAGIYTAKLYLFEYNLPHNDSRLESIVLYWGRGQFRFVKVSRRYLSLYDKC